MGLGDTLRWMRDHKAASIAIIFACFILFGLVQGLSSCAADRASQEATEQEENPREQQAREEGEREQTASSGDALIDSLAGYSWRAVEEASSDGAAAPVLEIGGAKMCEISRDGARTYIPYTVKKTFKLPDESQQNADGTESTVSSWAISIEADGEPAVLYVTCEERDETAGATYTVRCSAFTAAESYKSSIQAEDIQVEDLTDEAVEWAAGAAGESKRPSRKDIVAAVRDFTVANYDGALKATFDGAGAIDFEDGSRTLTFTVDYSYGMPVRVTVNPEGKVTATDYDLGDADAVAPAAADGSTTQEGA